MGTRAERKERRKKAEIEIRQAFKDSLNEIGDKGEDWSFAVLKRMVLAKISRDTELRFPDIIKNELVTIFNYYKEKGLI